MAEITETGVLPAPTANGHTSSPYFGPRVNLGKAGTPETKSRSGLGGGVNLWEEYGRTGLRHWGGFVFEEWLRELQQGKRAAEVYREMGDSDPVIGGMLYAIEMLIRRVSWWTEPASSSTQDKKNAEWMDTNWNDMDVSWPDNIAEILSFLQYGWALFEMVFKKRKGYVAGDATASSMYDDGTIGLAKLPIRAQDSLWKWVFQPNGEIDGMIQNPPPDYLLRYIPMPKALLFRTKVAKGNPEGRSVLRSAYRCFHPSTELLTEKGWKSVAEITLADSVATLDDIGVIEYQQPTELHEYDFDGEMVRAQGRYVDQLVTPNHNMYVKPQAAGEPYRFVEAADVLSTYRLKACGEWLASDVEDYEIPAYVDRGGNLWPRERVAMDDWLRFLGIYLSEGHAYDSGRQRIVGVSQKLGETADVVAQWVEAIGFPVYHHKQGNDRVVFEITRAQVHDLLAPLGKAKTKFVPDYVKTLSRRQIEIFLDAYWFGDGTSMGPDGGHEVIYTSSRRMADDLMELAFKAGYSSRIRWQETTGFKKGQPGNGVWIVTLGKAAVNGHRARWTREHYAGKVNCVTVPNHTVLARRNGMASWSGNSWYFVKNLQNVEGIGVERDLAGLPILKAPEGVDIWDTNDPTMIAMKNAAQMVVSAIRRDEQEGVILPDGWELTLLSSPGKRQFNTTDIITRYEQRIATSVLLDVILLGQGSVGSYSLATVKKGLFTASLEAYMDQIAEVFNTHCIPVLFALNGFKVDKGFPRLKHGRVEAVDLDTLGNYLQKLAMAGAPLFPNSELTAHILSEAGLPAAEALANNDSLARNDEVSAQEQQGAAAQAMSAAVKKPSTSAQAAGAASVGAAQR